MTALTNSYFPARAFKSLAWIYPGITKCSGSAEDLVLRWDHILYPEYLHHRSQVQGIIKSVTSYTKELSKKTLSSLAVAQFLRLSKEVHR